MFLRKSLRSFLISYFTRFWFTYEINRRFNSENQTYILSSNYINTSLNIISLFRSIDTPEIYKQIFDDSGEIKDFDRDTELTIKRGLDFIINNT